MGKGNCLLGFATMGVRAIRSAIGCLCCLVITGPIFFLVGIIMLVSPNNYEKNVKEWNSAVSNYTAETVPLLRKTTMTFPSGNDSLQLVSKSVMPTGNHKDVTTTAVSYRFTTGVHFYDPSSANLNAVVNSSKFTGQTQLTSAFTVGGANAEDFNIHTHTVRVKCNDDDGCSSDSIRRKCAKNIPSDRHFTCDSTDMVYTNGRIDEDEHATCTYYSKISYYCRPLKLQTVGVYMWVESDSKKSCDYPFTSQKRECSNQSPATATYSSKQVEFKFMAANDPHITLSKITKGDMDFGLTEAQQRLLGAAMIVIGALMIACMVGLCIAARDMLCGGNHEHRGAVYGAFGRSYEYPAGYERMNTAQPAYGQQPAQPGQQQYGQQQQYSQQQPVQGGYQQAPGGYPPGPPPGYEQQHASPQQNAWDQPQKPQQQGAYGAV